MPKNSPFPKESKVAAVKTVFHTLPPVFDSCSRVLILGSLPSPKSRELGFYYGHPRNRFWTVLGRLLREEIPPSPEGKRALLLSRHIALWDVVQRCEIRGAADESIRRPLPNDLSLILGQADIRAIFTTGQKAAALYRRLCQPQTGIAALSLPSTSPANCTCSIEALYESYRQILPFLEEGDQPSPPFAKKNSENTPEE
ncbi:MAG: DNA-deoxyinosine glycosylase [Provencibacterium sp.]|jgi:TDG/mug DNA glycosylase family protein|nr:DNA-deoxyinosine glycosylase [Provencibacterium sp.]